MSWGEQEWLAFGSLVEEGWPGTFDDDAAVAWRVLLGATPPADAVAALRRLLYSGRKFYPRPAVSDLLAEVRADPSKPTFDEMLVLFRRAVNARDVERGLAALPSLVRAFIARQGFDRMRMLPLDDPDWGEKVRRDLQAAWDVHCEAFDGREVAALASGSSEPHRLDPLAHLPQLEAGS